jgi:hypothetical protein
MDLSLHKNAFMLFRMLKVFRQPAGKLKELERIFMNNNNNNNNHNNNTSTAMRSNHSASSLHENSYNSSSMNRSTDRFSPHPFYRNSAHSGIFDDSSSSYICMFGDDVTMRVYELMQRVYLAKMKINQEVTNMERQMKKNIGTWERFLQFIGWLSSLNFSFSQALEEKKKTPDFLDFCLNIFSPMYDIQIEDVTRDFIVDESLNDENMDHENNAAQNNSSGYMNITPSFMRSQLSQINYTGDPELLPIMDGEIKFLVRLFYQISSKLNDLFENELQSIWNRDDIYGKFARQILSAPIETRTFDKSAGYSELQVQLVGPRISFRKFARITMVVSFLSSFIFGRVFMGASSVGFLIFITFSFLQLIMKAMISKF